MRETGLQTPGPVKMERKEALQVPEQIPLQHMEVHGGTDICFLPLDNLMPETWCLKETVTLWGSHAGAGKECEGFSHCGGRKNRDNV